MRVFNVQPAARPAYYDRNQSFSTTLYSAAGVAPAAQTTRASYTVPANRKCRANSSFARQVRSVASTTVGQIYGWIEYVPSGGSASRLVEAYSFNIAAGTYGSDHGTAFEEMGAGDVLNLVTVDPSVGGSTDWILAVKKIEFDA